MCGDARLRDAGDRGALPARAAALRHRRRPAARAAAALRGAARAPARRARPRRGRSARRSWSRTRAACSPHDRRPLARADAPRRVPPEELDRQRQVAAGPRRGGHDDLGRVRGGIRGRRGLGRVHDRARPDAGRLRPERRRRRLRGRRAPTAGSASSPSTRRWTARSDELERARDGPRAEGDQARPELPGLRPARRRRAARLRSSPSAAACRSSSTRARRRCGRRRSATRTRC